MGHRGCDSSRGDSGQLQLSLPAHHDGETQSLASFDQSSTHRLHGGVSRCVGRARDLRVLLRSRRPDQGLPRVLQVEQVHLSRQAAHHCLRELPVRGQRPEGNSCEGERGEEGEGVCVCVYFLYTSCPNLLSVEKKQKQELGWRVSVLPIPAFNCTLCRCNT